MQTPRDHRHTHVPLFSVYTSKYNTINLMLGVSLSRIASQRIYLKKLCGILLYVDVTHDEHARCGACVLRPRCGDV